MAVVVTLPPSLVETRQVPTSSWTRASTTTRGSSEPVAGLWASTSSPTVTCSMGLRLPSAITTGVPATKQPMSLVPVTLARAPPAPPVTVPSSRPSPVLEARPPSVCGPGPVR